MDISYSSTTATTYIHTIMFLHSTGYFQALLRRTPSVLSQHMYGSTSFLESEAAGAATEESN